MLNDLWPLANLSLETPRLTLREPDEQELAALAAVAARGIHRPEDRPFLTPWTSQPPEARARFVLQSFWTARGQWAPEAWRLSLGVFREGQALGMVGMRAHDFRTLREVTTTSWLGLEHQGQGYGTEARTALLALAFDHLRAESALTVVFQDNAGSQGVSRKLGYRPDGIQRDVLEDRVVISDRLRLTRDAWAQESRAPVRIRGLEGCLPFFEGEASTETG
ncbi:GNAT family N-acetyltransferase [Deinococcus hohokamensis]|uniref:GNAT family N-acetyltransferase n=1 Tax=Deinococcus hohokamensis TaxID=309883 RepID=A0ABV9I5D7_9DEIO